MSTGRPKDRDLQLAPAPEMGGLALPPKPPSSSGSTALVEYMPPVFKEEEEDLEIKLRRILENVPVRVSNTSGSSAGSGSGDFHQVRVPEAWNFGGLRLFVFLFRFDCCSILALVFLCGD